MQTCKYCKTPLIKIDHYEPDGVTEIGSYEPYFECPNDCKVIDTKTEYDEIVLDRGDDSGRYESELSSIIL